MTSLLPIIFLLALVAIIPLYAMYFSSLQDFGKEFQRLHPKIYVQLVGAEPPSFFTSSRTYKLFRAIQTGMDLGEPLDPVLLSAYRSTRKHLWLGLSCFMILLFAGLGDSVIQDLSSGA
ncbi:hypothetical protein [Luteimonas notoginsengisoli]|jgi:hypothetical protein|uniref:Type II secretion system protein GspF domain-containing protein n=1 Tax=Luteimonas notoginsengisoli TaxID=1578200 RepID=A0ABV7UWG1_9GAMM